jgi:2-methylcitrate dehydratase
MSRSDPRAFSKGSSVPAAATLAAKAEPAKEPRGGPPAAGASRSWGKPNPITTGPGQAEGIAKFACRAKYADLTAERRERLKVSVLDSLACAINALGASPIEACLAQAKEFGGPDGRCALIGGGRSNVVFAAFYNTALERYIDFMDSYFAHGGLCHPSDNLGAVLAVSEHAALSGKDFLTALAVAYQVETALSAAAPFMVHGFDLTTPLSYSLGAGLSKALGLDEAKTAAAVAICGAGGIPLLVVRTTPISQWKGLNSSQVAFECVHGVFLASRGVTGPK